MTRHRGTRPSQGQGDLLDLLADLTVEPDGGGGAGAAVEPEKVAVHILMPNMGLACGRDTLTVLTGRRRGSRSVTTMPDRATCPDCLAVPDLAKRIHAMQTRPAPAPRRRGGGGGGSG